MGFQLVNSKENLNPILMVQNPMHLQLVSPRSCSLGNHLLFWFLCSFSEDLPRFSNVWASSFSTLSPDPYPELHSMSFSWAFGLATQL